jgi:hypothetical protein
MTDAAAKRMARALHEIWDPGRSLTICQIEKALKDEDFWGTRKASYIKDLVQWMIENDRADFSRLITDVFIREFYEQREGIDDLTAGLMRLGVIPYPEED